MELNDPVENACSSGSKIRIVSRIRHQDYFSKITDNTLDGIQSGKE